MMASSRPMRGGTYADIDQLPLNERQLKREEDFKADGAGLKELLDADLASTFLKAKEMVDERATNSRFAGTSGRIASGNHRLTRTTSSNAAKGTGSNLDGTFGSKPSRGPKDWKPYKRREAITEIDLYHVPANAHKDADYKRTVISKTKAGKWKVGNQLIGVGAKPPPSVLMPSGALYDAAVWAPLLETREEQDARKQAVVPHETGLPASVRIRQLELEPSEPRAPTWNFARGNASSLAAASSVASAPLTGGLERVLEEARLGQVLPKKVPYPLTWHFAKPTQASPAAANSTMTPPVALSPRKGGAAGGAADRYSTYSYTMGGGLHTHSLNAGPFGLSPIPSADPVHEASLSSLAPDASAAAPSSQARREERSVRDPTLPSIRPVGTHLDLTPLGKTLLTRERKERVRELKSMLRGIEDRQRYGYTYTYARPEAADVERGNGGTVDERDAALRSFGRAGEEGAGATKARKRPSRVPSNHAVQAERGEETASSGAVGGDQYDGQGQAMAGGEEGVAIAAGTASQDHDSPPSAAGHLLSAHPAEQPPKDKSPSPPRERARSRAKSVSRPHYDAPTPSQPLTKRKSKAASPPLTRKQSTAAEDDRASHHSEDLQAIFREEFKPRAEHLAADVELRMLYEQVQRLRELVQARKDLPAQASQEITAEELEALQGLVL